jgi:hypothetical protein
VTATGFLVVGLGLAPLACETYASKPLTVDRYHQTWLEPYDQTTCAEWRTKLTPAQRWAGAAGLLTLSRTPQDAASGRPAASVVDQFEAEIEADCRRAGAESATVSAVAARVYQSGRARYQF